MNYLSSVPAILAGVYYLLALLAALRHLRLRERAAHSFPPVSILKPVRGRDPKFYEAIRSHAVQDYPQYEILFGVKDPGDAAVADIERLRREFPERDIRLIYTSREAPNGKVAVLTDLAREARYPILLVNDSDIVVEADYLRRVVAGLEDPSVGIVTCLYRASADNWPARWEAIGIATEFAPSVLIAPLAGIEGFALGSTMCFRAAQLQQIGGFPAIESYLADDYQLGRHISQLGYRVILSKPAVETNLSAGTWGDAWRHQLRWSRTIRVSRTAGYYGYLITQASFWCLVALFAGHWVTALLVLAVRMATGIFVGKWILEDRHVTRYWYLIPLRDLWGFAIWVAGASGDTVEWKGRRLQLSPDGRILVGRTIASSR